ncbi:MAG: hypothetical protein ACE5KS_00330 [Woeseiaceae bacterium]
MTAIGCDHHANSFARSPNSTHDANTAVVVDETIDTTWDALIDG